MSMKHPERYMKAADKNRRVNEQRIKQEERARRQRLQAERDAKKPAVATSA